MGCNKFCKAWCALFCEEIQTLDDSPPASRYPRPGRRRSHARRARVPQVVITRPSVARLRPVSPAAPFSPHLLSPPRHAPPRCRPASLFAGRDEVELRPLVGSLPAASLSSASSFVTAVEDSNTIIENRQLLPAARFRRWSWPLTSPDEESVSCKHLALYPSKHHFTMVCYYPTYTSLTLTGVQRLRGCN